jgi:hypothetical protein
MMDVDRMVSKKEQKLKKVLDRAFESLEEYLKELKARQSNDLTGLLQKADDLVAIKKGVKNGEHSKKN